MHQTGSRDDRGKINPETNTLVREGVASITNPFDEFAIEEGLLTKEKAWGRSSCDHHGAAPGDGGLEECPCRGCG